MRFRGTSENFDYLSCDLRPFYYYLILISLSLSFLQWTQINWTSNSSAGCSVKRNPSRLPINSSWCSRSWLSSNNSCSRERVRDKRASRSPVQLTLLTPLVSRADSSTSSRDHSRSRHNCRISSRDKCTACWASNRILACSRTKCNKVNKINRPNKLVVSARWESSQPLAACRSTRVCKTRSTVSKAPAPLINSPSKSRLCKEMVSSLIRTANSDNYSKRPTSSSLPPDKPPDPRVKSSRARTESTRSSLPPARAGIKKIYNMSIPKMAWLVLIKASHR